MGVFHGTKRESRAVGGPRHSKPRAPSAQQWHSARNKKLGDYKRVLRDRHPYGLPEDDAGYEYVYDALRLISCRAPEGDSNEEQAARRGIRKQMRNFVEAWAPHLISPEKCFEETDGAQMIDSIMMLPVGQRTLTGRTLGERLNLTKHEWERLRVWQLLPADTNDAEIASYRKERQRKKRESNRRRKGIRPRGQYLANSLSRQRPWVAEGISKSTWYRRRRGGTGSVAK